MIDDTGKVLNHGVPISNDRIGFQQLADLLEPYRGGIRIGLEATGHYWLALYDYLCHLEYDLAVINPLQVKAFRKMDIRKRKTDRLDSVAISEFMRFANPGSTPADLPVIIQLKELTRFRFHLVQQIGDYQRKIISILDRVFPEYEQLFSNVFLVSSRQLLHHAVTADEFAAFDLNELAQILHTASRHRLGIDKARQIHLKASQSVGVSFLTDAIHTEIRGW